MSRHHSEYAINELAKKAGVSVRTIRYYINEGLLPAPETRGRYTVYTDEYLDRLELIRRLKDSFLPLKEIRTSLASLSWEEVRATLADLRRREAEQAQSNLREKTSPPSPQISEHRSVELPPSPAPSAPAPSIAEPRPRAGRSSALDYIADLLSSTPTNRPLPPQPEPQVLPNKQVMPPVDDSQGLWQRVTLAEGVELHYRTPVRPDHQRKIDEIIRWAKKIFSS